jgi:hypothetical protein
LFGGGVGHAGAALGEDSIARDIAKILWSGVFLSNLSFYSYHLPFLPINYTTQWLRGSSEIKFRLSINMLLNDKLHEKFYLVILALPTDFYTDLYLKRMILCDLKVA